ncbi:hypothetical protein Glove_71g24 [Diversispora epigaea]|uniref:Uncharacterized protein n=1 Tax=Diversispora epigaea TaxID=1348612 RepID=A0A397JAR5_9GLOM|nr:hypothetical protein Glove_71g24 [Diversispora epigaea]
MSVMNSLSLQKIESVDEVYELLHKKYLAYNNYMLNGPRFNDRCWKDKMIKFEKKGIRPTSFFQSSFQLLEEENEENLVGPI